MVPTILSSLLRRGGYKVTPPFEHVPLNLRSNSLSVVPPLDSFTFADEAENKDTPGFKQVPALPLPGGERDQGIGDKDNPNTAAESSEKEQEQQEQLSDDEGEREEGQGQEGRVDNDGGHENTEVTSDRIPAPTICRPGEASKDAGGGVSWAENGRDGASASGKGRRLSSRRLVEVPPASSMPRYVLRRGRERNEGRCTERCCVFLCFFLPLCYWRKEGVDSALSLWGCSQGRSDQKGRQDVNDAYGQKGLIS